MAPIRTYLAVLTVLLGPMIPCDARSANRTNLDHIESATAIVTEVWIWQEPAGAFQEHSLPEPREIQVVPESKDAAALLVDLGLSPGDYEKIRLIVNDGNVVLTTDTHVSNGRIFNMALGNLSFPSAAQRGVKMDVDPSIQVVTRLSPELTLDLDLSRSFVFNGPPTHAPGVGRIVFTPVVPTANTSTHGRVTVRIVKRENSSKCAVPLIPHQGVTVKAIDPSQGTVASGTTDDTGDTWLELLPGIYDIVIEKSGYQSVTIGTQEVYLANETALGEVTLELSDINIAFDKDRATLLSIMSTIAYGDGRYGWGDLDSLSRGDPLLEPEYPFTPPNTKLKTHVPDYLEPCWRFFKFIKVKRRAALFVAYNASNGDIAVSVRGTVEWVDNVANGRVRKGAWTLSSGTIIRRAVHVGFRDEYLSVQDDLRATLAEAIAAHAPGTNQSRSSRVFFTGHSLGGALATLAALDLADELVSDLGYDRRNIVMYSIGAPRSLTEKMFTTEANFHDIVPHAYAVAARDDAITHIPGRDADTFFKAEYKHIPNLVVLNSDVVDASADDSTGYEHIGDETRIEASNGEWFEACAPRGKLVGWCGLWPCFHYGKRGHNDLQYLKRVENIVDDGIPELSIWLETRGLDRLWISWDGGVQGPCDWVALFRTEKGEKPELEDEVGNGEWAAVGDGFPDRSELNTRVNPSLGPVDTRSDFWVGYLDGFGRLIKTVKWNRPAPAPGQLAGSFSPSPNPTNSTMTFRYATSSAGEVRVSVYDVAGRLVRKLDYGMRGIGEHSESWDLRDTSGRSVSAGLYFLRLHLGDRTLMQKVVVTR